MSSPFRCAPDPLTVELTADSLFDELVPTQLAARTHVTIEPAGVCIVAVFPEHLQQELVLSHAQMGLLVNTWQAWYQMSNGQRAESEAY